MELIIRLVPTIQYNVPNMHRYIPTYIKWSIILCIRTHERISTEISSTMGNRTDHVRRY